MNQQTDQHFAQSDLLPEERAQLLKAFSQVNEQLGPIKNPYLENALFSNPFSSFSFPFHRFPSFSFPFHTSSFTTLNRFGDLKSWKIDPFDDDDEKERKKQLLKKRLIAVKHGIKTEKAVIEEMTKINTKLLRDIYPEIMKDPFLTNQITNGTQYPALAKQLQDAFDKDYSSLSEACISQHEKPVFRRTVDIKSSLLSDVFRELREIVSRSRKVTLNRNLLDIEGRYQSMSRRMFGVVIVKDSASSEWVKEDGVSDGSAFHFPNESITPFMQKRAKENKSCSSFIHSSYQHQTYHPLHYYCVDPRNLEHSIKREGFSTQEEEAPRQTCNACDHLQTLANSGECIGFNSSKKMEYFFSQNSNSMEPCMTVLVQEKDLTSHGFKGPIKEGKFHRGSFTLPFTKKILRLALIIGLEKHQDQSTKIPLNIHLDKEFLDIKHFVVKINNGNDVWFHYCIIDESGNIFGSCEDSFPALFAKQSTAAEGQISISAENKIQSSDICNSSVLQVTNVFIDNRTTVGSSNPEQD